MMKSNRKIWSSRTAIFCAVALACLLLAGPLFAEELGQLSLTEKVKAIDLQIGTSVDLFGKYIWRGQTLVDEPVIQPGISVGFKNFTASIWGNYTLSDQREWTELDYTLDYTTSLEAIDPKLDVVSVSVGYIYYEFPNLSSDDDTQEVYAAVSVDTLLAPSLTIYHDYDQGEGTYYEIGASHSLPLDKLTLNLSATVGYNDDQWGLDSSFSSAALGATLTLPFTETISLEPGVYYSVAMDSQYDDEVYAGLSFAIDL